MPRDVGIAWNRSRQSEPIAGNLARDLGAEALREQLAHQQRHPHVFLANQTSEHGTHVDTDASMVPQQILSFDG
jgi:hypothetical protein